MAQFSYSILNVTAAAARSAINNVLSAIVSQNSGSSEPSPPFANMIWYDSSANILKMRNENNSTWITLATLDQAASTASSPATFATTQEAEDGNDTTKTMNAARVKESIEKRQLFSHLAVGSYAHLTNNTTSQMNAGSSYAGSSLLWGIIVGTGGAGTAAQGTWRLMGQSLRGKWTQSGEEGASTEYRYGGLFLRIS